MGKRLSRLVFISILVITGWYSPAKAQDVRGRRPVDMMIVVDNSCSMFPANQILPGCDANGGDPDFLRIAGADLFIARLGYSEPNEAAYRLGIVSMGDNPVLVSPLTSVKDGRASLAAKIANPKPQPATRLIPAMEMAYSQFEGSPGAADLRTRALVMITDGIPYPTQGQSNTDIEQLISQHTDIPLFIMLLKNPNRVSGDFENYILFWQKLQAKYPTLNVYLIEKADQIEVTYNQILGELQSTIANEQLDVSANGDTSIKVSSYTQKLIITAIRKLGTAEGSISIFDPDGNQVTENDAGVSHFYSKDNPVEVFSISPPRLSDNLLGRNWKVSSNNSATIMVDLVGSYQVNITSPEVRLGDIAAQYFAIERQSTSQDLPVEFQLIDRQGQAITVQQFIQATITSPANQVKDLVAQTLTPDSNGTFTINIGLAELFNDSTAQEGRYTIMVSAGRLDPNNPDSAPVAVARLYVDFGMIPYIRTIAPSPLICKAGQSTEVRVILGDVNNEGSDPSQTDQIKVRVFSSEDSIWLEARPDGSFRGDVTALCQKLITSQACSVTQATSVSVQLDVVTSTGVQLPTSIRDAETTVIGLVCTPTPLPTPTPMPTPTPTPPPDNDRDGILDINDQCPSQPGLAQFGGCIPWNYFGGTAAGLVVLVLLGLWVIPWIRVARISPPPEAYILVCEQGVEDGQECLSIKKIASKRHTTRVAIGGNRARAHIFVKGLKPVEFYVEWEGGIVTVRSPGESEPFTYFTEVQRIVHTSNPKVTLHIGVDANTLRCS